MAIIKEVTSFEDFTAKIVDSFPDLCVYKTSSKSEASNSEDVWYFDTSFEDKKVKFVTSFEDVKIQFVNSRSSAGWKNQSHPLKGRIG